MVKSDGFGASILLSTKLSAAFEVVENARDALNRCAEVVRTELPKFTDKDLGSDWRDLIIAHALQSEAKRLIDGEPSSAARPANRSP